MKTFITYLAKQRIEPGVYDARGRFILQTNEKFHYPICPVINGYTTVGDEIRIIVVYDNENIYFDENFKKLKKEVNYLKNKKGFNYKITKIEIPNKQYAHVHLDTYSKLLSCINDGDELYADISYGNKPMPIIEFMVLNSTYELMKNVSVKCISYGDVLFWKDPREYYIYDITPLFTMSRLSYNLAKEGIKDPISMIKGILKSGGDKNEL